MSFNKTFKKALLFSFVFNMFFIPNVFSIEYFEIDEIWYYKDNNNVGVNKMRYTPYYYSGDIVIPSYVTYKGNTYPVKYIGLEAFSGCTSLTSIQLPETIISIGEFAFQGCIGLTSINFPSSLKTINSAAFNGCTGLSSLSIPSNVKKIGSSAFLGCTSLTSVTIPEGVTEIGSSAFQNCTSLSSVTIPNSVTYIDYNAFANCTNLTNINVSTGNKVYDSRENSNAIIETATNTLISGCNNTIIPESVTSLGYGAFYGCLFSNIEIPNNIINVGASAFCNCKNLTSITLPNNIKRILPYTFKDCYSLHSIAIPESVKFIDNYVFYYCSSLTTLTCFATEPPQCENDAFNMLNTTMCKLMVPEGCTQTYKSSNQWGKFSSIEEFSVSKIDKVLLDNFENNDITAIYDLYGRKSLDSNSGLNIIKLKNGSVRKIYIK